MVKAIKVLALMAFVVFSATVVLAQSGATATPALIQLPSPQVATPTVAGLSPPTITPTVIGVVVLEALTEANVRGEPDIEGELYGTIRAGDLYTVLGRYYRWLKLQYDQSPTQTAWVFDELVTIKGDQALIPDLAAAEATAIAGAAGQTPTVDATVAVGTPVIQLPVEGQNGGGVALPAEVLPTYTYPPNIPAQPPSDAYAIGFAPSFSQLPQTALGGNVASDVPPILPILLLGLGGVVGLFISTRGR